jgi:hypothetical protein
MRRIAGIGGMIVLALAGCSDGGSAREPGPGEGTPAGNVPGPHPPPIECTFPAEADQLLPLRANSDLVVQVTVASAPEVIPVEADATDGSAERYVLSVVQQFESRSAVNEDAVVVIEPAGAEPLLSEGDYILFLAQAGLDEKAGSPAYYIANGLRGTFPIRDGGVALECPNYDDPSNRLIATPPAGGPMAVNEFTGMLTALPRPDRDSMTLQGSIPNSDTE